MYKIIYLIPIVYILFKNKPIKAFFFVEYLLVLFVGIVISCSAIKYIYQYVSRDKILNYREIMNVKYNNGNSDRYENNNGIIKKKNGENLTEEEEFFIENI